MIFGLSNSLATFKTMMNDILIFSSQTKEKHYAIVVCPWNPLKTSALPQGVTSHNTPMALADCPGPTLSYLSHHSYGLHATHTNYVTPMHAHLLCSITPFWQFWLIPVTSGAIELRIAPMTPHSTSQSTPMKPKSMPTVHSDSLHSSSHLILSMDSLDNPDNPRLITDQGTRASIPASVFWASTNTRWASGHTPHPLWGQNLPPVFHQPPTLFPHIVIISCCLIPSNPVLTTPVHTLDSFTLTSPYPLTLGYNS